MYIGGYISGWFVIMTSLFTGWPVMMTSFWIGGYFFSITISSFNIPSGPVMMISSFLTGGCWVMITSFVPGGT